MQEKGQALAQELSENYGIESKFIYFDYKTEFDVDNSSKLKSEIEQFESVSILINNFNDISKKQLGELEDAQIQEQINSNITAPTMLIKYLLNKLTFNGKRGAIINISSEAIEFHRKDEDLYSSTKSYLSHLSERLSKEQKNSIDIISVTVGPIQSKDHPSTEVLAASAESVCKHSLKTLGHESHTFGCYKHGIRHYFLNRTIEGGVIRCVESRRKRSVVAEEH